MTLLAAFGQRIRSEEVTQWLAALLALLSLTLIISWPTIVTPVNDSWASVSIVRRVMLAVVALYWGTSSKHLAVRSRLLSAWLLIVFALLSTPFELAALAASVPLAPLPLVLLLGFSAPLALYGFTLIVASACRRIRLGWLALPLALLSVAGLVYADLRLDAQLFNPVQQHGSGWPQALLLTGAALLTLALLFSSDRRISGSLRTARSSA